MATRRRTARRTTRRRNPIRSTGALIINPRRRRTTRRRATTKRRNTATRRRTTTRRKRPAARRRNGLVIRRNTRKRATTRRRTTTRRRRNPVRRRATTRRRRPARRRNSRLVVNRRRRNPRRRATARRRNPVRRRRASTKRRSNPRRRVAKRRNSALGGLKKTLKKIPLIGGVLASMIGFAAPAAVGAVAVYPTMFAAKMLGKFAPNLNASAFYAGAGLLVAAVFAKFAPKTIMGFSRTNLATAIASAAGGVAAYKWLSGQDTSMAAETAGLSMSGFAGWGDGMAYQMQQLAGPSMAGAGATYHGIPSYGAYVHGR